MFATTKIQRTLQLLLAQTDRYHDLGHRFRQGGPSVSWAHLLAIGAVLAIVIGVLAWIARRIAIRDGRGYRSPRRLFRDLCRLHEVDWSGRRLLGQLARAHHLPHSACLFVKPECFHDDHLSPALQPLSDQVEKLRRKIFGDTEQASAD